MVKSKPASRLWWVGRCLATSSVCADRPTSSTRILVHARSDPSTFSLNTSPVDDSHDRGDLSMVVPMTPPPLLAVALTTLRDAWLNPFQKRKRWRQGGHRTLYCCWNRRQCTLDTNTLTPPFYAPRPEQFQRDKLRFCVRENEHLISLEITFCKHICDNLCIWRQTDVCDFCIS